MKEVFIVASGTMTPNLYWGDKNSDTEPMFIGHIAHGPFNETFNVILSDDTLIGPIDKEDMPFFQAALTEHLEMQNSIEGFMYTNNASLRVRLLSSRDMIIDINGDKYKLEKI